jgi:hypothetical protein
MEERRCVDLGTSWGQLVTFTTGWIYTWGKEAPPRTDWIGGWVGPRAGLDYMETILDPTGTPNSTPIPTELPRLMAGPPTLCKVQLQLPIAQPVCPSFLPSPSHHRGDDTSTLVMLSLYALHSGHVSLTARGMFSAVHRPRIELQAPTVADYGSLCGQPEYSGWFTW